MAGIMLVTIAMPGLMLNAAAEIDCGEQVVCDATGDEDTTPSDCDISARYGDLTASVLEAPQLSRSPVGVAVATNAPVDDGLRQRWIITACEHVELKVYAGWTSDTDTDFCLTGEGEPGRPNCIGVTVFWVQVDQTQGAHKRFGCGGGNCDYLVRSTDNDQFNAKATGGVSIDIPFNEEVPVTGHARGEYWEDRDGDGSWSDESGPFKSDVAQETIFYYIGATPPGT